MPTYTQTYLPVDLKSACRCKESKTWRAQRIGGRQDDAAVVDAIFEGRGGRTADGEVPGEEVFFGWRGVEVGGRLKREFLGFPYWIES